MGFGGRGRRQTNEKDPTIILPRWYRWGLWGCVEQRICPGPRGGEWQGWGQDTGLCLQEGWAEGQDGAHLQFALPLQKAVVQQVSVPHGSRHLLQQGCGSLLVEDAAQQVFLQLQHRQLLLQAGALCQGRLGETRLPWRGELDEAGAGTHLVRLHLPGRLGLCAGGWGSGECKEKQAGGKVVGDPECQGQSESLLTLHIHLVTKSRARRLPPVSVRNLSPLHWLPLTVVHSALLTWTSAAPDHLLPPRCPPDRLCTLQPNPNWTSLILYSMILHHRQQRAISKLACGTFWIPDHLTCLLRNLNVGQEATVRTLHGTNDWFKTGKGVCQSCRSSPCLFNLYAEYIMRNPGLDGSQAGIKISRRNVNHLTYADDTVQMAESEDKLKCFLMRLKTLT